MLPPQARPTSQAVSSAMPKCSSLGRFDFNTSTPSSNTAPSTQPPLTEPVIFPSGVIAILAPARRGDEPHVWITVASAMDWLSLALQLSRSDKMSRMNISVPRIELSLQHGRQRYSTLFIDLCQSFHIVGFQ